MPKTIDAEKLVSALKNRVVKMDPVTMNDVLFSYSLGSNAVITTLLIEIATGQYDLR